MKENNDDGDISHQQQGDLLATGEMVRQTIDYDNPIDVDGITFREALNVTEAPRKRMMEALSSLPLRGDRHYLPGTMSEATSYVNAREDAKKKQGVAVLGKDFVSVSAQKVGPYPGAREGAGDAAAFWLYAEDYFRDVTQEDVHEILSFLVPIESDRAFDLEPLGKKPTEKQGGTETDMLLDEPSVSNLIGGSEFTPDLVLGRRSRRASSRLGKTEETPGVTSGGFLASENRSIRRKRSGYMHSTGGLSTTSSLGNVMSKGEDGDGVQEPTQMTVTLTPEGGPAKRVLDALEDHTVASLLGTIRKLRTILDDTKKTETNIEGDSCAEQLNAEMEVTRCMLEDQRMGTRLELANGTHESKEIGESLVEVLPSSRLRHPWTSKLLNSEVPNHVKEAVKEAYYLEPPASALAQRFPKNMMDIAQEEYDKGLLSGQNSPRNTPGVTSEATFNSGEKKLHEQECEQGKVHIEKISLEVMKKIADGPSDEAFKSKTPYEMYLHSSQDAGLLYMAPQDELAAETLALQAELISVMAANRARLVHILENALEDLPIQAQQRELRQEELEFVKFWFDKKEQEKTAERRYKRNFAQREAMSRCTTGSPSSRPVLGQTDDCDLDAASRPILGVEDLYDVLAQRNEEDEAFCAVCGDGFSVEPNVIIFCDRCDIAVHQRCYDIHDVPQDEWLCWPCKEFEDTQRAAGQCQDDIRPLHMLPEQRRKLPGGSREVHCCLCPIRFGAFRKTVDGSAWVHQTCALWHPETFLVSGTGPNIIDGVWSIPDIRFKTECDLCGKTEGAVVACGHSSCPYSFHVMCARNCGLYLTVQKDKHGQSHHRVYCALHSKEQQDKDSKSLALALKTQDTKDTQKYSHNENFHLKEISALSDREYELSTLSAIRVNLEACRVLLDLCKRREKVKKHYHQACFAAQIERMKYPSEALAFMDTISTMKSQGMSYAEKTVALWSSGFHGQQEGEIRHKKKIKLDATCYKDSNVPILHALDGQSSGRSSRRSLLAIEKQKVLSSAEAEAINSHLPPGIKYVPIEQLQSGQS